MKKIVRNTSTADSERFWQTAERSATEVKKWPDWKRAGINVSEVRREPRQTPPVSPAGRPESGTESP